MPVCRSGPSYGRTESFVQSVVQVFRSMMRVCGPDLSGRGHRRPTYDDLMVSSSVYTKPPVTTSRHELGAACQIGDFMRIG
jgi:hypothetical protein